MNEGKKFELMIKESVPHDVYYYRLQDSATGWSSSESNNVRFTPPNKFDCMMFKHPMLVLLELKSTQGTSIPFSMIKDHQINELTKASVYKGIVSGFLFNFRKTNTTYFMEIKDFLYYQESTDKKSINEQDIIKFDGLIIEQSLKRVKWKFHLESFFENLFGKYINIMYNEVIQSS